MRLVAEHDDNRVVVAENVEQLLEIGSKMVKVENVAQLLAQIRVAARTLLPREPVDPTRLEEIAGRLKGLAVVATALANKVPADDPDAAKMRAALEEFGLTPRP